jgi:hypothetical protein
MALRISKILMTISKSFRIVAISLRINNILMIIRIYSQDAPDDSQDK